MFPWSTYGYLLFFKPCITRIRDNGSRIVAIVYPSIKNSNNDNDTKVGLSTGRVCAQLGTNLTTLGLQDLDLLLIDKRC